MKENRQPLPDSLEILPDWLSPKPMVVQHTLSVPPPRLEDNTADVDRLVRALRRDGFFPVRVDPWDLDPISQELRRGGFTVTVVVGYQEDHWEILELTAGTSRDPVLGVAVDLGSSRLAFYLLDLEKGIVIDRRSEPNPQIPYGEDILTRIVYASDPDKRRRLQELLLSAFRDVVARMAAHKGLETSRIFALTVAGNTTMSHFFLGLNTANICKEPYIPVANRFPFLRGRDLALPMHPKGLVFVFPNVGSYFGGDLMAGILASGMHRREELSLLVDVGTNAEVVLGNKDWLIACAGAAGPALEGGVVERGMMAGPGAIDWVRIDPHTLDVQYRVIGQEKPKGLCGSGLIDLVAEMFMAGILTIRGTLNRNLPCARIVDTDNGPGFVVAWGAETADGRDLVVSEIDIGILLKSKAAMYTILNIIARKVGVSLQEIHKFYVAGTFGNHIDPVMAIRIGMLPDLPLDTYEGLGNTAGRGAAMVLVDRTLLKDLEQVRNQITYVELNVNVELMHEFRGATFLPHTDPGLFPSVPIPDRAKEGL
ncbi:Uncharacterized 2Fe-2 and 4Fe-4S clusters-containing protein, contains DUF4445 domain [Desulfacinum hydrothermale DSM 13146]|uniref:Uncharacterized 2Fe-2 and 4Fe-4S clusters-containing protein, contains DUF4445 domain n=1 Tax=Desulfacinum hydrothermale DSM 13146 TaxID=1121390 RepID=A0A1W1XRP4_9BACT|nr:ASKHA domain-containing protein [Desulfacinum hydrothermale]SMC26566.1 Uncharacterized 2Fe-2 and 4Fe-4S clusters-containing protein, contains DUF4445 domain [Desulfacinum hydrothermale DSM 13146]